MSIDTTAFTTGMEHPEALPRVERQEKEAQNIQPMRTVEIQEAVHRALMNHDQNALWEAIGPAYDLAL